MPEALCSFWGIYEAILLALLPQQAASELHACSIIAIVKANSGKQRTLNIPITVALLQSIEHDYMPPDRLSMKIIDKKMPTFDCFAIVFLTQVQNP